MDFTRNVPFDKLLGRFEKSYLWTTATEHKKIKLVERDKHSNWFYNVATYWVYIEADQFDFMPVVIYEIVSLT